MTRPPLSTLRLSQDTIENCPKLLSYLHMSRQDKAKSNTRRPASAFGVGGHNPKAGQRLQVYPLDLNLANQAEWNLVLLCPRCQGVVRAVDWEQGRFFPVEDWLIPYRAFGS
jgi:hypothetical protein